MLHKYFALLIVLLISEFVIANDTITVTVQFAFNKYTLSANEQEKLYVVKSNNAKPIISIEIYGHTDQIGLVAYNQRLSLKRAETVKKHLLNNGIDESFITLVAGKGKSALLTQQNDAASRSLNRRVTLTIVYQTSSKTEVIQKNKNETTPQEKETTTLTKKIQDTTVKQGDNLILKNINFIGGRHLFLRESYPALEELYEAMLNIPTLVIDIQGHICCSISDEDGTDLDTQTKDLSVRRAKAVYDYLLRKGISPDRMTYKGFGRKFPLTEERDEMERSQNRRVEIKIIRK
ncbi:MAG: OmpA family protein [Chitinophagaceae bacterium]|jgi:outer membrane protein OmpA-like peptidoglycan-associated protein|nr:OmpA family protein [Chitinophagaceae bacterium]